jgi:hypothetical protein
MRRYLSKLPRSTEEVLRFHERYLSPITLLVGFTIDAIIIRSVDLFLSNVLLFLYLMVAASGIILFHLTETGKLRGKFFFLLVPFIPAIIQFAFGGLFSGFVILYSQSAAYATSWIFVVILAALLIGNERFRRLYTGFAFQASILFATLVSFLIFFLPFVSKKIGTDVFLAGEIIAIIIMIAFVRAFAILNPEVYRAKRLGLTKSAASIFLIFNVLYFTNAIPPIPLALKDAGVYHSIKREGGEYRLEAEPLKWYERYLRYKTVYHRAPGERVYVFSSVFAPTKLSTTIVHEWEAYDPTTDSWEQVASIRFPIVGGRDGGYRGYTVLDSVREGFWRVNVRTADQRLVGRVSFEIQSVAAKVETESVTR